MISAVAEKRFSYRCGLDGSIPEESIDHIWVHMESSG